MEPVGQPAIISIASELFEIEEIALSCIGTGCFFSCSKNVSDMVAVWMNRLPCAPGSLSTNIARSRMFWFRSPTFPRLWTSKVMRQREIRSACSRTAAIDLPPMENPQAPQPSVERFSKGTSLELRRRLSLWR